MNVCFLYCLFHVGIICLYIDIKNGKCNSTQLTSSEFKDLSYEHEAGFSQGVFPPIWLITVV